MDSYQSLYLSYRAAMPPQNAVKLLNFIKEGRLEVTGGLSYLGMGKDNNSNQIEYIIRKDQNGHPITNLHGQDLKEENIIEKTGYADYFVSALGQSKDPNKSALWSKIIENGLAKENPYGGILINTETHQMGHEKADPNIYAIGPMAIGHSPNQPNSAMLTNQSRNIAAGIAQSIMQDKAHGVFANQIAA